MLIQSQENNVLLFPSKFISLYTISEVPILTTVYDDIDASY